MTEKIKITSKNLQLAVDKSVSLPAQIGTHIGRGFLRFPLGNISKPHPQLGNDAFTEAYFTTNSGNIYRIQRNDDKKWILTHIRDPHGEYEFRNGEMDGAVLEVGQIFVYGGGFRSTTLAAILAVNASRCYVNGANEREMTCDIRNEFEARRSRQ